MDTVRATATYRRKCLQVECETTRRLITEILSNNYKVLESLRALENDADFVDECCDYQHHSQINILQANLILQKFLKTPVPVRKNVRSINTCEQSSNFYLEPLPLIECTRLDVVGLSVCENSGHGEEQVTISDLFKTETKVNNHSDRTVVTLEPEKDDATEEDENKEQIEEAIEEDENKEQIEEAIEEDENKEQIEKVTEKETLSSDFVNNQSVEVSRISEELIKTTYDFAQVPFTTENDQTTTKSHLKDIVEARDKNVTQSKGRRNYANSLKNKGNSNNFVPNFSGKVKKGVEIWPSLKLLRNTSNKFSSKNSTQTEISTKPNYTKQVFSPLNSSKEKKLLARKNCPQTCELKCSTDAQISAENAAPRLLASKTASLKPILIKEESQISEEVPESWDELLSNISLSPPPPLESVPLLTESSHLPHQENFEIQKGASLPLESPSRKTESSDSASYHSITQESKLVCHPSIQKSPNKVLDSSDSPKCENHAEFLPVKKTSEWETNTWGRRRITDNNNILNHLKGRDIVSIEERHRRSIPRARMPDISMKPSSIKLSQKQKSILKTDSEEDIDDILDENDFTMIKEDEGELEMEEIMPAVPQALEPKCEDYFLMSDIRSPGLFYIQIANEISVCLDELEAQMKRTFKNRSFAMFSSKFEAKKEMGNFVCVEINHYWLRVEVIDWYITSHKTKVKIQYIDYGCDYEVNYHALRPLPTDLYSIPRIAQRCHLTDLYPINSVTNSPGRRWEYSSKSTFIKLCGDVSNNQFELTTIKYCSIRKSYGINFKTPNGESISDILVKRRLAIHIVNKKSDFFEKLDLNANVCLDSYEIPTEQIWNAYWYNEHIARSANNHNASYNSSSHTGKKYKNINELVVTQPDSNQDLPSVGELRRVMITHVVDIETFYGHIDELFDNQLVHPGESLHNLHEYMNTYNMVKKYTSLTCTPAVSQLVIAPHPIYLWCRAQVRQIGVPDKNDEVYAELFYIDYGMVKWVPLSAVRNMVKCLNKFPCLAIEFKMCNIEHRVGASRETEKEFLEMYLKVQELFIVIKAVPGHVVVQLLDHFKIDIGETLINHGIGQWKTENIYPSSDSHLLID